MRQHVRPATKAADISAHPHLCCSTHTLAGLLLLCCRPHHFHAFATWLPSHALAPPPPLHTHRGVDSGIRHSVGGADYGSVRVGAFMGLRIISHMEQAKVCGGGGRLLSLPHYNPLVGWLVGWLIG